MFGQMMLGFHRVTDNNMISNRFYHKMLENKESLKSYNIDYLNWISIRENYETTIAPIRILDTSIEIICPFLLLITGWKLFAIPNILHLIVYPLIMYNSMHKPVPEFTQIMQVLTIFQLLGLFMFLLIPNKS